MKIVGKVIYVLWACVIALTLSFYCFSCYIGAKVEPIVISAIESMGEDYADYDNVIEDFNYLRLWHEIPNNASYDRVNIVEEGATQEYSISHPYIVAFKDRDNGFFSLGKVGYIYNNKTVSKNGEKTNLVATENSKVILSLRYNGLDFVVDDVYYDNDFNDYGVSRFHGIWLALILIVNAFARNIRYFNFCALNRKKKNVFRMVQPYFFSILIFISFFTNTFPLMLLIGMAQEVVFTIIFTIKKRCLK